MKKWYKSKTYWFNTALAIVGYIQANENLLQGNLQEYYGYFVMGIGMVGILLRSITKESVSV